MIPRSCAGFERIGDLFRDRQRLVDRDRAARDPLRQVLAFDEFRDEGRDVRRLLETVDRPDVRMIEGRKLPYENHLPIWVCRGPTPPHQVEGGMIRSAD